MKVRLALRDFFFPPRCPGCYDIFKVRYGEQNEMCADCLRKWQLLRATVCPECGNAYIDCRCAPKSLERAGVNILIKLVPYLSYRAVSNNTVLYIKKRRDARVFEFLSSQLAYEIEKTVKLLGIRREDIVLSFSPRRSRAVVDAGFDQAKLLATGVCEKTGIKKAFVLRRTKGIAAAQKKLDAKSREKNVQGAFSVLPKTSLEGKTVFLIDDLVTTGSTMAECARVLKKSGAALVIGVCVAYTEKSL